MFDEVLLAKVQKRSSGRFKMYFFMWLKLPLGAYARLRVDRLDPAGCDISLPHRRRTLNPFGSTYWAAQGMAAELSTGLGVFSHVQAAPMKIRMIVKRTEGYFLKQAKSRVVFSCVNLPAAIDALKQTMKSKQNVDCAMESVGLDEDGDVVSRWTFDWSFRAVE